jgi:hypothetical protein
VESRGQPGGAAVAEARLPELRAGRLNGASGVRRLSSGVLIRYWIGILTHRAGVKAAVNWSAAKPKWGKVTEAA